MKSISVNSELMDKEWYKSKGMWAGILLIAKAIVYDLIYEGNAATASQDFLIGFGLVGIRRAED